jgi:hypothetical protein
VLLIGDLDMVADHGWSRPFPGRRHVVDELLDAIAELT